MAVKERSAQLNPSAGSSANRQRWSIVLALWTAVTCAPAIAQEVTTPPADSPSPEILAEPVPAAARTASPQSGVEVEKQLPQERYVGKLEVVARFQNQMPTGVAVSNEGRIFVCFPRWTDAVETTVAELKDGQLVPYPNADIQSTRDKKPEDGLVSVQAVTIDPNNRLWLLDTGSINFGPTQPNGPKLLAVDLASNIIVKRIDFDPQVVLPTTYLNDIRFDLRRGSEGMAFITDSSGTGPNGIIVVDLASGRSWRRLNNHPSVRAHASFIPKVEGQPLFRNPGHQSPDFLTIGADGIAISEDGKRLYYCPLASRQLYSVSVDALADPALTDEQVAKTVQDLGMKGASDGLETDAQGRVYCTDYEHNTITVREPDGRYNTLVHDPRLLWPDTLDLAADGHLYIIANQLHRQSTFQNGQDLREKPYLLFRVNLGASPVLLR